MKSTKTLTKQIDSSFWAKLAGMTISFLGFGYYAIHLILFGMALAPLYWLIIVLAIINIVWIAVLAFFKNPAIMAHAKKQGEKDAYSYNPYASAITNVPAIILSGIFGLVLLYHGFIMYAVYWFGNIILLATNHYYLMKLMTSDDYIVDKVMLDLTNALKDVLKKVKKK